MDLLSGEAVWLWHGLYWGTGIGCASCSLFLWIHVVLYEKYISDKSGWRRFHETKRLLLLWIMNYGLVTSLSLNSFVVHNEDPQYLKKVSIKEIIRLLNKKEIHVDKKVNVKKRFKQRHIYPRSTVIVSPYIKPVLGIIHVRGYKYKCTLNSKLYKSIQVIVLYIF